MSMITRTKDNRAVSVYELAENTNGSLTILRYDSKLDYDNKLGHVVEEFGDKKAEAEMTFELMKFHHQRGGQVETLEGKHSFMLVANPNGTMNFS